MNVTSSLFNWFIRGHVTALNRKVYLLSAVLSESYLSQCWPCIKHNAGIKAFAEMHCVFSALGAAPLVFTWWIDLTTCLKYSSKFLLSPSGCFADLFFACLDVYMRNCSALYLQRPIVHGLGLIVTYNSRWATLYSSKYVCLFVYLVQFVLPSESLSESLFL